MIPEFEPVAYGVRCETIDWVYIADYKQAANEHINDAIEMGLREAAKWRIVPLFTEAQMQQAIEAGKAEAMVSEDMLLAWQNGYEKGKAEMQAEPVVDTADGPKSWWELALHVGAWKTHDLDYVHFGSEMAVRAYAILLLKQRDRYEEELKAEIKNQAVLIEQLGSALSVSEAFVDRHSEEWYLSGQSDLKVIRDALKAVEEWRKKK